MNYLKKQKKLESKQISQFGNTIPPKKSMNNGPPFPMSFVEEWICLNT